MNTGSMFAIIVAIALPIIVAIYFTLRKKDEGNKK
jgi:hypothetical protein